MRKLENAELCTTSCEDNRGLGEKVGALNMGRWNLARDTSLDLKSAGLEAQLPGDQSYGTGPQ